jgi:curved DNA-binding protein
MNKSAGAEEKFKEINEAHEVLGDPEKRRRYDALGGSWRAGQDFTPPPGFESAFNFGAAGGPGVHFNFGGTGFSSFFESLFGDLAGRGFRSAGGGFRGQPGTQDSFFAEDGQDIEAPITITVEDAYHGAKKSVVLEMPGSPGNPPQSKTFQVRVPPGTTDGKVIRLKGQGQKGPPGGRDGDLLLRVTIAKHPRFRAEGCDVFTTVPISPWEAALGARVRVPTLDETVSLNVPPGSQSGQKLRLRGKGLPRTEDTRGDMFVEIRIVVPETLSDEERDLLRKLQEVSGFKPRGED